MMETSTATELTTLGATEIKRECVLLKFNMVKGNYCALNISGYLHRQLLLLNSCMSQKNGHDELLIAIRTAAMPLLSSLYFYSGEVIQ